MGMLQAVGIKDYVGKVLSKVKAPNQSSANDEVIEVGDFRLNVTARKANLHGEELDLSSAEFDLLLYLINHPRHLITPKTKLATSWTRPGSPANPPLVCGGERNGIRQTDFLNVLLSLRKKLESRDSARCYIRTEPWVFYRFDATASAHQ